MKNDAVIHGHGLLAVERFQDDTRHMIIFDVLDNRSTLGEVGERVRLFLSDNGYALALADQKDGHIRIKKHAAVVEGHLLSDKKRRHR